MTLPIKKVTSILPIHLNRITLAITCLVVGLFFVLASHGSDYFPDTQRSPSKPRPIVVVSAGAIRSGSTVLYNALRILMRIRDPNTIFGWRRDLTQTLKTYGTPIPSNMTPANALRSSGTSVLVKVHTVKGWKQFQKDKDRRARFLDADLVFTSHRDPRKAVISMRRMRFSIAGSASDLKRPEDFCVTRARFSPFSDAKYRQPSTWVRMANFYVICHRRILEAADDKLAENVDFHDLTGLDLPSAIKLLRRLGQHLDGYTYTSEELALAARELLAITSPRCESPLDVHPVTHLHCAHDAGRKNKRRRPRGEKEGIRAIEDDRALGKWLADNGYRRRSQRKSDESPR